MGECCFFVESKAEKNVGFENRLHHLLLLPQSGSIGDDHLLIFPHRSIQIGFSLQPTLEEAAVKTVTIKREGGTEY